MIPDDEDKRREGVENAAGCLLFLFVASLLGLALFAFAFCKVIQFVMHR